MKSIKLLFISLLLVSATGAVTCALETVQNLEGKWIFCLDRADEGVKRKWFKAGIPDAQEISVPALWEDAGYPGYDGIAWYEYHFTGPREDYKNLVLRFQAIDDDCTVWLNGVKLGEHHGWNTPFFYEIKDRIKPGADNRITVQVRDFGGGGGIYKPVDLVSYDERQELFVTDLYRNYRGMPAPSWLADANIYEVFLRTNTPDGNLAAFKPKLAGLADMGVEVLWFMPMHPVGAKKRKGDDGSPYAISDYYAINPEFGTLDEFKGIVKKAHELGMKVIIDLVANHTAWDNRLTADHPDWYRRNEKGEIIPPNPDWDDVAGLNYDNPALNEYMAAMMCYWLKDADIDGFRCDVAGCVPHKFWNLAYERMLKVKPEFIMLAESTWWEQHTNGFHMTYDNGFYHHLVEICNQRMPAEKLAEYLAYSKYNYPRESYRLTFIENHDQERAVNVLGWKNLAAAAVVLFTAEGIPLVYQGQEIGLAEPRDIFNQHNLHWQNGDQLLRELYEKLYRLRAKYPELRRGETSVVTSDQPSVCAYVRSLGRDHVFVAANFGDQALTATLASDAVKLPVGKLRNLVGDFVTLKHNQLSLDPHTAVVIAFQR